MTKYDAIIIGSGQGGNPLAKKLANANWKVALIERKWVGGTCINVGCTPTKTMISSGRIAHLVKNSADYGIHTSGLTVNMEEVVKRKNSVVLSFREGGTKGLLKTPNLDLLFGNAVFSGPKEVTVVKEDGSREILTAEKIFINTGLRPLLPPVAGLDEVNYLTSTSIMDLLEIPAHLVIIGSSYIALEFGQLYRRLGSEVTIIERGPHFLSREDEDIAAEVKKILEEEGLNILIDTTVTEVAASGKEVQLKIKTGETEGFLTGSHVLVATGREPDTTGLNTAVAGIALDKGGFIQVNDSLETSVPGIYALGDVKGGPAFTHISYNDYLILYKNLLENGNESTAKRPLVYCMFTDPELGRVGLSEKQAREKGLRIKVAKLPMTSVARGIETGETRGLIKAVVDADSRKIIGASVLAPEGGELMSVLQMAILGGVTYDVIRDNVFAHPTFSESLNNLFMTLDYE
ncbi:MAG TPA: mercuric reductase [Puia sp.]|nr:mercuric reductase [Puia sp.]